MNLRTKAVLGVCGGVALLLITLHIIFSSKIIHEFEALERDHVNQDIDRVTRSLQSKLNYLPTRMLDWAAWDDCYNFIINKDRAFIDSNLVTEGIVGLEINLMIFFDTQKQVVSQKFLDYTQGKDLPMPPSILETFKKYPALLDNRDEKDWRSGILMIDDKPLLFGARPIITSEQKGPIRGTLVWGRFLSPPEIETLKEDLRLDISVKPIDQDPGTFRAEVTTKGTTERAIFPVTDNLIAGETIIKDYFGNDALLMRIVQPREFLERGLRTNESILMVVAGVGALYAIFVIILMETTLIRRIRRLALGLLDVSKDPQISARLPVEGNDEISMLSSEINQTLEALSVGRLNLVVAKEIAERASQTKSTFVSTISHEIRTPLNGILGIARSLRQEKISDDLQWRIEVLSDCADSLLAIVNDILDFSKLEAGKLQVESAPFSLPRLVQSATNTIALRAQEKGLQLTVHSDPNCHLHLVGDQTRLLQILINLLGNAVKFTQTGSVTLSLHEETLNATQSRFHFAVTDTGMGMTPDQLSRVFEAFSQADGSITRRFGGSGLGLTISRRFVELMGGTISATSTLGIGTTISFAIPMQIDQHPEQHESGTHTTPDNSAALSTRVPLNVLVVDDVESNLIVARLALNQLGHQCVCVGSGKEAIEKFQNPTTKTFDIVLMDLQMPEMSGLEVAQRIKEDLKKSGERIPIIALTANRRSEAESPEHESIFDDWLAKPLNYDLLATTLVRHTGAPTRIPIPAPPAEECTLRIPGLHLKPLVAAHGTNAAVMEILECFLEESTVLLDSLLVAVSNHDYTEVRESLHALKGSLNNIGATELAQIASRAETSAKERLSTDWILGDYDHVAEQLSTGIQSIRNSLIKTLRRPDSSLPGTNLRQQC